MNLSTVSLLFASLLLLLEIPPAHSQWVMFSEDSGSSTGWSFTPWGALEASTIEHEGLQAILLKPGDLPAKAWAGVTMGKWKDPLALDQAIVTDGVISFKFNSTDGGGQRLQVSFEILDGEGNPVDGTEAFIPLSEISDFAAVDDDPETWQSVSVPLLESLNRSGHPAESAHFLGKIAIQYIEDVPEKDLLITEVKLDVP